MITFILTIIGFVFVLVGLAGCILPVIPGPLVGYLSLLILSLAQGWETFSATFLLMMAVAAVVMTVLDYFVSLAGAKKYGATKAGIWGSLIGMLVGLFFFPPLGILIGALLGAVAGELMVGKKTTVALRVGWGVFVGNLIGIALKLAYCLLILFFYIKGMF